MHRRPVLLVVIMMMGLMVFGGAGHADNQFEKTKRSAVHGDATSQFLLGFIYYYGEGVPLDYQEALKWFLKSARQGNIGAQFLLGVMYFNGNGTAVDHSEAVKWYLKSAEQGHSDAQYYLANLYYAGERCSFELPGSHEMVPEISRTGA